MSQNDPFAQPTLQHQQNYSQGGPSLHHVQQQVIAGMSPSLQLGPHGFDSSVHASNPTFQNVQSRILSLAILCLMDTNLHYMHLWINTHPLQWPQVVMFSMRSVLVIPPRHHPQFCLFLSLNVRQHHRRHYLLFRHLLRFLKVFHLRKRLQQSCSRLNSRCRCVT